MNNVIKTKVKLFLLLLIAVCFVLSGCDNAFRPPVNGGAAAAIGDGYGKLHIRFAGDEGRTIFPAKDFLEYVYTFYRYDAPDGENEIESLVLEPGAGGVFTVEVGFWAVEVKAYAGEPEEEKLAAAGFSGIFEIGTGSTRQITIILEEIIPADAEDGAFSYTIFYPEDTEVSTLTLKRLPSLSDEKTLTPCTVPGQDGITEALLPVPAGFYLLTVQLTRYGKYTGTNEVIHIYPHLETRYTESFSVTDFLDSAISISAISGVTPPAYGETPVAAITETAQFTGTVEWYDDELLFDGDAFEAETVYTAVISLAAKPGYTFAGAAPDFFTVAGATTVNNLQHTGEVRAVFPATLVAPPAAVSGNNIPDIIVPVVGVAPVSGELVNSGQYTGTVEWNPNDATFLAGTTYTATITLTAEPGYTFTGVTANFFSVKWASTVSNGADSGVVTAVFTPAVVTFDSNGGNPVDPVHTFIAYRIPRPEYPVLGEKYDLSDSVYSDFTFTGWFYDENFANPVTFISELHDRYDTVTSDITLYAKWLPGEWKMIDADPDTLADMFPIIGEDENGKPIQDGLDGDYFLSDDISLDGYTGPDGHGWVPMGTSEESPFTGTFDGNGRKITYLFIEMEETRCVGLFGAINSAVIRNLGVEIHDSGVTGLLDVGGITGNAKNSLIENCYVKGNISAKQSVGGIAAHIGSNSIVRNCYTMDGAVESLYSDAGGIVGNMKDGGTIENCYSTMTVRAASEAGGIVAIVQDRYYPELVPEPAGLFVFNCVAINPEITGGTYAGRIVGKIEVGLAESPGGPFGPYDMGTNTPPPFYGPIIIENNYALDVLSSPTPTGHNDAARGGISRTDLELKSQSTYESLDWEFGNDDRNPWKMPIGGGYPILYWEEE